MEEKNKRIVKNTTLLYIRSFISLLISLYSSRLILQGLGFVDYGIYNAVGGFVSMFWVVSSALSSSATRFLNYEMGRHNQESLNEVFSISLNSFSLLGLFVLIAVESAGWWFLTAKMNIPPERMSAAGWVFHASVFTVVSAFPYTPFISAIIAHEKMGIFALVNIAEVVFKLFIALFLVYGHSATDRLIMYAVLLMFGTLVCRLFSVVYAYLKFPECRFRPVLLSPRLKEMLGFAWWNLFGGLASTFSGQGVNMALNISHGPILNSARGLATTVSNTVSLLTYNFTMSLKPQITQTYAEGDISRTKRLVFSGTKFAAYLMLFIVIPFILEADFILHLWLGEIPEYTTVFVRLSLIYCFLNVFDYLFSQSKLAAGNIRTYQIITGLLTFLNFPLAILLLKSGYSPVWIYITPLVVQVLKILVTLITVKKVLYYPWKNVFQEVYLPVAIVSVVSSFPLLPFYCFLSDGWFRFVIIIFVSVLITGATAWFMGCTSEERTILKELLR